MRLAIRKVQFAPVVQGPQPTSEISKRLLLSDKPINLEATLDKELYYHGETLSVNVQVSTNIFFGKSNLSLIFRSQIIAHGR